MYILHLSDLHFSNKNDADRWYRDLAYDLQKNLQCEDLDALIISGDVASHSTPEEYEVAKEFIIDLMIDFQLKREEVVIVPGNHDFNFKKARAAYETKHSDEYSGPRDEDNIIIIDEEEIKVLNPEKDNQKFKYFANFYQTLFKKTYFLEPERQYTLHYFKNSKLLVLGLNSAWQLDHHYLLRPSINFYALDEALQEINANSNYKNSRLKIAVWHHPLNSPFEDRIKDRSFVDKLANNGFRLALHGHIHQNSLENHHYCKNPGNGLEDHDSCINSHFSRGQIDIIAAGTSGAPVKDMKRDCPLEYNLLTWEGERLTVCCRKRNQPKEAWQPFTIFGLENKKVSCYKIEPIIPKSVAESIDPVYEEHKKNLIKAVMEGAIVPFLGADINLCDRQRKDTNPLEWQVDGPYPPTNCELAAYINASINRDSQDKTGFLDRVIDLLISSTFMGELPKGLTRNKLQTIAGFSHLEPHRVSQYVPQSKSKLAGFINYIYTNCSYRANSLHEFLVYLIKEACPSDVNENDFGATSYPLIVNTCFDRTLENLFEEEKLSFDLVSYTNSEKKFVYQQFDSHECIKQEIITERTKDNFYGLLRERPVILRIYGPVELKNSSHGGENFALSEDHFLDYLAHDVSRQLPDRLRNKLLNGRLWFLGYNLSYWYLRFIIRQIIQDKRLNNKSSNTLNNSDTSQWWAVREKSDTLNEYLWINNGVTFFDGQTIGSWQEYSQELKELLDKELSQTANRRQPRL